MRLATAGLTIGHDGCIIANKAAKYQIPGTNIENLLLRGFLPEDAIELELFIADLKYIFLFRHANTSPRASGPALFKF